MSNTYFAAGGSYGVAKEMIVVPTHTWTDAMWNAIEEASDHNRGEMARHFSINVHREVNGTCVGCLLTPEELAGQNVIPFPPKGDNN